MTEIGEMSVEDQLRNRIDDLESRIAKVREMAAKARALPAELCRCSSTVGGHDIGCAGVIATVAWTLDPQEVLAVLDGEGEKPATGGIVTGTYLVGEDNSGCVFPVAAALDDIPEQPEIEIAVFDTVSWKAACQKALDESGFTYDQLARMARRHDFASTEARKVWLIVRGTFEEEKTDG